MRAHHRLILLLIGMLALAACISIPAPTPTATQTTAAVTSEVAQPATTPAPANTPGAASPSTTYPPRPTATAYAAPKEQDVDGVYSNPEHDLKVRYPDRWFTAPPDPGSNIIQWFVGPGGKVIAGILSGSAGNDSLESTAGQIRDAVLNGLTNIKMTSDEATSINGYEAWTSIVTAQRDDGSQLKVNITSILNGGQLYTAFTFGAPADFDAHADEIQQFLNGIETEKPRLFGLPRDQALVQAGGESRNPRNYDPATTHGSGDKLVFSGLVSFDPKLNLVPDLAESWDVSPDGKTYTFHLRSNARFHNGQPVTAADVVYSWERAADPKTDSDTVLTYLGDIVGVKDKRAGQADHIGGLKVIDDQTLQVTIDAPKPYFLLKLTYPTAFVLDRANVESGPDWYRAPNGSGPYRLARWESFKSMLYERNEDYYLEPPQIPYLIFQLYSGAPLRLYESGEIDVTGVGGNDLNRFTNPGEPMHNELLNGVSLCTGMIKFDNRQPPFDDPKVRQAFSLAFNRRQYIDIVQEGDALPATGVLPPGLPGYNANLQALPYDPERARQLLAESKYGGPAHVPPIVFTVGGHGSDIGRGVSALAQMWQQNLGISLTVENLDPNKYIDLINAGQHGQIFGGGWCADYPDPENFLDVLFHTGAEQNDGHYSNPEVDQLLEAARVELDVNKRLQLYQQAEQLIVDDAPVIFTLHGLDHVLVKPYVKGYVLTPIAVPLERFLSIDASQMK